VGLFGVVCFFFFSFPFSSFIPFRYEHIFLLTLFLVCLHALLVPKGTEDFWHREVKPSPWSLLEAAFSTSLHWNLLAKQNETGSRKQELSGDEEKV